ncbi:hypothetical protein H257_12344 [Aphanomyces astaci]|uniref:Protein kinase domain-containing protein n=1 Tax=Aphanomyces astaci TaxID=112090 RepID=W4FYQ0_APHAT|nr:hypothetical protein H257_12344 [Aphanomyces astaci]ETV72582.1 hypothetical protein H257_12344 [Aphanomyces astaci]|eukprot:XP_009837810.1 hypothetical protein H257_12344 [Aphanomyces astaci]
MEFTVAQQLYSPVDNSSPSACTSPPPPMSPKRDRLVVVGVDVCATRIQRAFQRRRQQQKARRQQQPLQRLKPLSILTPLPHTPFPGHMSTSAPPVEAGGTQFQRQQADTSPSLRGSPRHMTTTNSSLYGLCPSTGRVAPISSFRFTYTLFHLVVGRHTDEIVAGLMDRKHGSIVVGGAYRQYLGSYQGKQVVIKALRQADIPWLQHEEVVLSMFGHHPSTVPFVGACTNFNSLLAVMTEFISFARVADFRRVFPFLVL